MRVVFDCCIRRKRTRRESATKIKSTKASIRRLFFLPTFKHRLSSISVTMITFFKLHSNLSNLALRCIVDGRFFFLFKLGELKEREKKKQSPGIFVQFLPTRSDCGNSATNFSPLERNLNRHQTTLALEKSYCFQCPKEMALRRFYSQDF